MGRAGSWQLGLPGKHYAVNGGLTGVSGADVNCQVDASVCWSLASGRYFWIHVPNPFHGRSFTLVVAA